MLKDRCLKRCDKLSLNRNRQILAWFSYDWGSQALPALINSYVFAIYFTHHIANNPLEGTYLWANALVIASILIAILSPLFGAAADQYGKHKTWLFVFTYIAIVSSALLWYAQPNNNFVFFTLFMIIIQMVSFEIAVVFYNAYLVFLGQGKTLGTISAWGWGLGYFGGIAVLLIAWYLFVNNPPSWLDTKQFEQIRICAPLAAIWFAIFSLPLFIWVENRKHTQHSLLRAIKAGCKNLFEQITRLNTQNKNVLTYLLARMIYNDGLITIFAFGGIYLANFMALTLSQIILFGVLCQLIAGLGAILFGRLDDLWGSKRVILLSLSIFSLGLLILIFSNSVLLSQIVILCCCLFIGSIQASSRTLLGRISAQEDITQTFGLYGLTGRVSAFLGPWIFGLTVYYSQSFQAGLVTILIFLIVGAVVLIWVKE